MTKPSYPIYIRYGDTRSSTDNLVWSDINSTILEGECQDKGGITDRMTTVFSIYLGFYLQCGGFNVKIKQPLKTPKYG